MTTCTSRASIALLLDLVLTCAAASMLDDDASAMPEPNLLDPVQSSDTELDNACGSSLSDSDDDVFLLSTHSIPRHREARTTISCLKQGGVSARAPISPCSVPKAALYSNFQGRARPQNVRFDPSADQARAIGLTYARETYDRTPIQPTQGSGSPLDLSLHRCHSFRGDEDDDAISSPLAIRIAQASSQSDYFGSSWSTRVHAGHVVGFDTGLRLRPLSSAEPSVEPASNPFASTDVEMEEEQHDEGLSNGFEWDVPPIRTFADVAPDGAHAAVLQAQNWSPTQTSAYMRFPSTSSDDSSAPSPLVAKAQAVPSYVAPTSPTLATNTNSSSPPEVEHMDSIRTCNATPTPAVPVPQFPPRTAFEQEHPDIQWHDKLDPLSLGHEAMDMSRCSSNESWWSNGSTTSNISGWGTSTSLSDADTSSLPPDQACTFISPRRSISSFHSTNASQDYVPQSALPQSDSTICTRRRPANALNLSLSIPQPKMATTVPSPRTRAVSDTTNLAPYPLNDKTPASLSGDEASNGITLTKKKKKVGKKRLVSCPSILSSFGDDMEGALGGF